MKKFIENLKNSLGEFFYNGQQIPLSSEVSFSSGKFVISISLVNHNDLVVESRNIELVDIRLYVNDNCEVVSEFIDFPLLGYPEVKSEGLSLEESRNLILETLGTKKAKFTFETLQK